jgi:DNA helicase-2/ATP-dependent DNA helicase PcrA
MIEPTIFLGPPGTGKTTTLLDTVDMEMERGVPPDRIGFMTFTKRGVEEAVTRAAQRFNVPRNTFRFFNTLHSAAFRHLGLSSSQVFTGKKVHEFGIEHGFELYGGLSSDDGTYSNFYGDDLILFLENYARITRIPLEQVLQSYDFAIPNLTRAWACIHALREHKATEGLFDFTDMIERFVLEDDPPRLEVLIVDEAQDLSELQWKMVELLSRHVKRMYAAGDDDQTIFTWAGASTRFISMPGCVKILEQSYRVPETVWNLANRVISSVRHRRDKAWMPREAHGSYNTVQGISMLDTSLVEDSQSVMMLGRTVKAIRNKFIPYCRANGYLYRYFENSSIRPIHAAAIEAWNRLQEGYPISAEQATKIYALLPSEKHGKGGVARGYKVRLNRLSEQAEPPDLTIQELRNNYGLLAQGAWNEVFTEIPVQDKDYIQKVIDNGFSVTEKPKIHISTIHRVKGGQANLVVLLSDTSKSSDKNFTTNQDEETRVFYTGITRTYEDLVVIHPEKKHYYQGLFE